MRARARAADSAGAAVGPALLEYARELAGGAAAQAGSAFTDIPEADALIKASPTAFLLGVLFTQGMPAERAWAGPWLLSRRVGHLDLRRLSEERASVDEAVCRRPGLHRFKHTMAGWVSDAAQRLLECYEGDAARIWAPGSSVADVGERLAAFRGIGRKKSAMAVEILVRHFGARLSGERDRRVAYDVHVRRVFLRSGLVGEDTPAAVADAARSACPEAPGSIDLATWLVGRTWCRPNSPRCDECRLGAACPRRVALTVEGVGAPKGRRT